MSLLLPIASAATGDIETPISLGRSLSQWLLYAAGGVFVAMCMLRVFQPTLFFRAYRATARFTQHKHIKPAAAAITVVVGGYFTVKKAFGWSLSATLDSVFHSNAATHVSFFLLCVVVAAVLINAFNIWFEHNPPENVLKIEPEGISRCVLRINNELERHLEKIRDDDALVRARFTDGHAFEENVGLIVDSLVDHAVASLKGFKVRRRDIFVSVYVVPDFERLDAPSNELCYLTHYPPNRDSVGTKRIVLNDPRYRDFACVRCAQAGHEFICSLDCNDYARGSGKRTKTLKHYFGFSIKANDRLVGFLNIELHNENFFVEQDQLEAYAENHLILFKYLIAHQFLKAIIYKAIEGHLPVRPRKFSPQTS